ncbi:CUE domain-containing protein 2 isoform X1 [Amia ocellicauda]|uniref:CUE domain-containing protein 2 isoform X1 n=1 Tax=Amia ocellicauda TaxID=2972642 RepID=UPI003463CCE4
MKGLWNIMEHNKIIQDALYEFIRLHIPNPDLSTLDEVILSYITGVLEDLGSQESVEENFDVEVFVEMLEAYIPGCAEIDSVEVCEMMFNLAARLATARNTENSAPKPAGGASSSSDTSAASAGGALSKKQDFSVQLEGATAKEVTNDGDSKVQLLLEMFPKCSVTEANSALSIAKWDMEEAVRLIVEGDLQLSQTPPLKVNHGKTSPAQPDEKLKASILEKYMLVDSEEDKKIHRPVTPKEAPKKMVRYLGSQVVSTKGERYQQVKKEESEEMKKTYISLKPARKYRFH